MSIYIKYSWGFYFFQVAKKRDPTLETKALSESHTLKKVPYFAENRTNTLSKQLGNKISNMAHKERN